jgi:hypothetical protein
MDATASQIREIREGLQTHISMGAQGWERKEIVASYVRSMKVELTGAQLDDLLHP